MRTVATLALVAAAVVMCFGGGVSATSTPTWHMKRMNFATLAAAIDCENTNTCIAPVVNDGSGTVILMTNDGGATWTPAQEPFEMMLISAAIDQNNGACGGPFSVIASFGHPAGDWNFTTPQGEGVLVQSQNVEPLPNKAGFGAVGGFYLDQKHDDWGAGISQDGGATWWYSNASSVITCWTRYGAYPTPTTWYISGGNWPEDRRTAAAPVPADSYRDLSARIRLHSGKGRDAAGARIPAHVEFRHPTPRSNGSQGSGYLAQLLKTTDGGHSWVSQFTSENEFYFNQIGCGSENHCCAVGEAAVDSKYAGVRVWCTFDGSTWAQQFYNNDPTLSALSLQFLDDQTVWVGGASLRQELIEGVFWHSEDGGKTWAEEFVKDVYPAEMTFGSPTWGLATGFDLEGNSCLLEYS